MESIPKDRKFTFTLIKQNGKKQRVRVTVTYDYQQQNIQTTNEEKKTYYQALNSTARRH